MKFICKDCGTSEPCIIDVIDGLESPYACPYANDGSDIEANWEKLSDSDCFEMRGLCTDCSNNCDFCNDANKFEQKRKAATPEPTPTGNGHFVLFEVLKDICARADAGQKKYGTMLRTENGRDALNDALQEAIDLVFYLKQKTMEESK